MTESKFQTRFLKWLKKHKSTSAAYELKITKGLSLPFNAVLQHQKDALVGCKHRGIAYKIPDDSRGYKPWDCFYIKGPAFVVIMYYVPRKPTFIMIDIDDFLEEEKNSDRKSLTEDRAKEIGIECSFK